MTAASSTCINGYCGGGVRCEFHAVGAAKAAMEARGWVTIEECEGRISEPISEAVFQRLVQAIHGTGIDIQRWVSRWDPVRRRSVDGVWAPKRYAPVLACLYQVPTSLTARVLMRVKADQDFSAAVECAYRLGGVSSVHELIDEAFPGLYTHR